MSDGTTLPFNQQIGQLMAQVYALVRTCPAGRVTTYGWLGKAVGHPRGARMIGFFMHDAPPDVPAQRVINSKGELSGSRAFGQIGRMRELLEADGIVFSADGKVDMKRYAWDPNVHLSDAERETIIASALTQPVTPDANLLYLLQTDPASPFKK